MCLAEAFTLTDHPWIETLEWPKSELFLALSDQKILIEERNLTRAEYKALFLFKSEFVLMLVSFDDLFWRLKNLA